MDPTARIIEIVAEAAKAHAQGRLDDAERLAIEALRLSPNDTQATLLLGVLKAKTDRPQEACDLLRQVALADSGSFFARYWLAVVLRKLGRLEDAAAIGFEALRLKPDEVPALVAVGSCLLDLGRFTEAVQVFTRAVRLAGKSAGMHEGLGLALQGVGKDAQAIQELRIAHRLDPRSESIGLRLGAALLEVQDFQAAEASARTVLSHHPQSHKAHDLLARALMDQGRGLAALEHSNAALVAAPSDPSTLVVHGSIQQNLGQVQDAEDSFRRAIEIAPTQTHAYFAVVHNRKVTEADRDLLEAMDKLAQGPSLPEAQKIHLQYGLGKANNDLANYGQAMKHYDRANQLAHKLRFHDRPYDRRAHEAGFKFVQTTLTQPVLEANRSSNTSDVPIFVIGMMRSGTTLVEQILSSHSEVGAAGEQRFWPEHHMAVLRPGSGFAKSEAERLGRDFVKMLKEIAPQERYVIDKMPVNYSFLGVIYAALPNARFIHVQRHPVDTCLSIYFTPNRSRIEWAHDKSNISFAYRQYLKLMDHWTQALPADRILHVRYEDLVLKREETTREMLHFCDLEWEDACLHPEENDRSVLTPSVWQVRQPVYTSSLERWRKYEPWLGAFRELL